MMTRVFAMPSPDTFSIKPIAKFVHKWVAGATVIVDPFARNGRIGTHTNDLNPATTAQFHMEAAEFCRMLAGQGLVADVVLFDPPYSPRQVTECYAGIGRAATTADTQSGRLYKEVRDAFAPMVKPGGVVLSFGWNSVGMGINRGYQIEEILLVSHGGAHNDTIYLAERRAATLL